MSTMASQFTSLAIVYSTVYLGVDQRKHQSSASLAFVWEIHRGSVNSPHKWPVTLKMFPFDDVIMAAECGKTTWQAVPANTQRNKHVIITPKRRFGVIGLAGVAPRKLIHFTFIDGLA